MGTVIVSYWGLLTLGDSYKSRWSRQKHSAGQYRAIDAHLLPISTPFFLAWPTIS